MPPLKKKVYLKVFIHFAVSWAGEIAILCSVADNESVCNTYAPGRFCNNRSLLGLLVTNWYNNRSLLVLLVTNWYDGMNVLGLTHIARIFYNKSFTQASNKFVLLSVAVRATQNTTNLNTSNKSSLFTNKSLYASYLTEIIVRI